MTFSELVSTYQLDRTEGVVLRYLADAYRAIRRTVPEEHRTEEVLELTEWLGELVRGVDSSLLDEWERLSQTVNDDADGDTRGASGEPPLAGAGESAARPLTANLRALRVLVRNAMFRRVELASREDWRALATLGGDSAWTADAWHDALDPMFEEYGDDAIGIDAAARSSALVRIVETGETPHGEDLAPGTWFVRQTLADPDGDRDWVLDAVVDLAASDEAGHVVVEVVRAGRL
jgi:hypothetical protein